jgi:hypothetical protein
MKVFRNPAVLLTICLALVFGAASSASAQVGETTEIIRGRVTDPDGKPVSGASVIVTSLESNINRQATTDENGRYTVLFRDGGGRYLIAVSFLGFAPRTFSLVRQADEDVLIANAQLSFEAIAIQGIEVRAQRPAPGRGETAQQGRDLPDQLVQRLPLDNFDPATLAGLAPGVITTPGDSLDIRGGFSVAGQREALNQVTLDGGSFNSVLGGAGSPLSVPQEGVRRTQVVTNTFDVARGQFSGGQVAMTTRGGSNRLSGSMSWNLRDPALQAGDNNLTGNAYTQNRFSGGLGGPIVRDQLFYYVSLTLQRRSDDLFALEADDPLANDRLGTDADSITRFLDVIQNRYGVPTLGETGPYERIGDAASLLGRMDWNITDRHSLMVRANTNLYQQNNARIGLLELKQNGGEVDTDGWGGMVALTSRFGQRLINDFRLSVNREARDQLPFARIPEGRVRVTSILEDGTTAVSSLTFGGERSMPVNTSETTNEVMDELSFLYGDTHRLKLGLLLNQSEFTQINTNNIFGSFSFNSLADFDARRPTAFTRTLAPRTNDGGGINAALYAGDTWRPTQKLQFTYGVRVEGSRFNGPKTYNAAVDSAFDRRTDDIPSELHLSPRAGVSWRLSEDGAPLRLVRGGAGEFRGRAPFSLFASAADQSGLLDSERQLFCIGASAPTPDWAAYLENEAAIPSSCGDGSAPGPLARSAPSVTVFAPEFGAPRSWRASLGYQHQIGGMLQLSMDGMYTRGVGLYGVRDMNLDETRTTTLGVENRLFFGDPRFAVAPGTGETTPFGSRIDPRFTHVYEVGSGLESSTAQVTAALSGILPPRIMFQASWTLMRARDESSFSCCSPAQGFSQPTTGANPNVNEWATSNLDRRHILTGIFGYNVNRYADLTLINRLMSGQPFTPMVGGDVNGDGARNDRAFIFSATAADTGVANGMQRLLGSAPDNVRECLQQQTNRIAGRNTCRGDWYYSLDGRVNVRPATTGVASRLNLALDLSNLLDGFDQLLHGSDDLRGWGQMSRADGTLLYPRGFDAASQTFRYVVNEQFGRSRTQRFGFGQPFQAHVQVRINVGAQSGGVGIGAIAGRGGPGGGGRSGGRDGSFQRGGERQRFDASGMIERLLANNPITLMLELRDSLELTPTQVAQLEATSDTLNARVDSLVAQAKQKLASADEPGPEMFREISPLLQQGREELQKAMQEARKILTPKQWRRLPENVRNTGRQGMRFQ